MKKQAIVSIVSICIGLCVLMLVGCVKPLTKQDVTRPGGKQFAVDILPPKEAFEYIKKNKGNDKFVILDIRTPEEFKSGHIEGAVNIDFRSENFGSEIEKLDKTKHTSSIAAPGIGAMMRLLLWDLQVFGSYYVCREILRAGSPPACRL